MEIVNFWGVGYPANAQIASSASQLPAVALEWYFFHFPGIIASDRITYLRQHHHLDSLVLFLAGYLATAAVFALFLCLVRLALNALRKLSSPLRHAH